MPISYRKRIKGREQEFLDAIELYGRQHGANIFNLTDPVAVDKLLTELGKDENFGKIPKVAHTPYTATKDGADLFFDKGVKVFTGGCPLIKENQILTDKVTHLQAELARITEQNQRNLDLKVMQAVNLLEVKSGKFPMS